MNNEESYIINLNPQSIGSTKIHSKLHILIFGPKICLTSVIVIIEKELLTFSYHFVRKTHINFLR